MSSDPNDLVRVASGSAVEMELLKQSFVEAGIDVRVLGESLGASFGSAIPGSVELIVHKRDEARARKIVEQNEAPAAERQKFPKPVSDPTPKGHGGHGPHTHYNADPHP